jgi:hypothetical protein
MLKRSLRVVWILVVPALVATILIVLVEMTGVNLVSLAE